MVSSGMASKLIYDDKDLSILWKWLMPKKYILVSEGKIIYSSNIYNNVKDEYDKNNPIKITEREKIHYQLEVNGFLTRVKWN